MDRKIQNIQKNFGINTGTKKSRNKNYWSSTRTRKETKKKKLSKKNKSI